MAQVENTADPSLPGTRDPDAVDPELLELPAPPRGRRLATLVLMALVVVASMAVVLSLRHDLAYFFASTETTDLGDVRSISPATLRPNTLVRVEGTPMMSRAVRYRRVLTGSEYVVFPLAGQRTVYVQVNDDADALARTSFSGRLVTFSQLGGRIDSVERFLGDELELPVSGESFLILADDTPREHAWALLVALLCLLFVVLDVFLILRWFRPIREEGAPAEADAGAT